MGDAFSVCVDDRDKDADDAPLHKKLIAKTPSKATRKKVPHTFKKLSTELPEGWRKELGEFMETRIVSSIVIALIFVDLGGTAVNDTLENSDYLNPKYSEQGESVAKLTHTICVSVLCIFLAEQLLHLVAYGEVFFTKIWMVMDLVIVCLSLLAETVLEDTFSGVVPLLIILRLWKICAFVFDCLLANTESTEKDEKEYGKKRPLSAMAPHKKLSKTTEKTGCRAELGELLESPMISGIVIFLIFVDLGCTAVNDTLENTDLLNPKYHEGGENLAQLTHKICVSVLCVFFTEQVLHVIACGWEFFTKFWMVMDLTVVSISFVCETTLEDSFAAVAPLMVILRLWKLAAFIFDCFLADDEDDEKDEKVYGSEDGKKKKTFTVVFTPGAIGAELYVTDGMILSTSDFGQCHNSGVKPGMQIVAINGKAYNDAMLKKCAVGDYPYKVTFKRLSRDELTKKHYEDLDQTVTAFTKLSQSPEITGWRKSLGEKMESPIVSAVVIGLIFVDLFGTAINDALENTDFLNPVYHEQGEAMAQLTHKACVTVLVIFFLEQCLHIVAFGKLFFSKIWMVMDLVVVTLSLLCETVLEDTFSGVVPLLIILRLWKLGAFIFDCLLAHTEDAEKDEKEFEKTGSVKGKKKRGALAPHKKLSKETDVTGCRKTLGEFLESPTVSAIVVCLIFVDLGCTALNDTLENTNLLNPKYKEDGEYLAKMTHSICVGVLCVFFAEQILHLIAFGIDFFTKFWMVMDLVVVSLSLLCETVLEDAFADIMPLLILLRLWKLVAFIFDMCLAHDETDEKDEKEYGNGAKDAAPEIITVRSFERPVRKVPKVFQKLSDDPSVTGCRKSLGEVLESPMVSGIVICFIFVDLFGTAINDTLENTNVLNPKYGEQGEFVAKMTHKICVTVLCIFFAEQILHLIAFGELFFTKIWMVMDLVVVTLSLLCETVLEDTFSGVVPLLIILRLWKLGAFVFDCLLAHSESSERDEKEFGKPKKNPKENPLLPHSKLSSTTSVRGCRKSLGEVMESPHVSAIVIALIFVDLGCTAVNDALENTDLLNPRYHEQGESLAKLTHQICVSVLVVFFSEQLLHIVAFGCDFFTKIWMVLDLVVVSLSLMCETVLEDTFAAVMPLMILLRLWKLVAFVFDCCLADDESDEKDETEYGDAKA
jgi:hypothetical protein